MLKERIALCVVMLLSGLTILFTTYKGMLPNLLIQTKPMILTNCSCHRTRRKVEITLPFNFEPVASFPGLSNFSQLIWDNSEDDSSVAAYLHETVRVLCWVMTSHYSSHLTVSHVNITWGKRCNTILFMSSKMDKKTPGVVQLDVREGRQYLWEKTQAAFSYIYNFYLDDADWFLKADDDTYVIVENLRHMLSSYNSSESLIFGRRFKYEGGFLSGGAGYVLSRAAVNLLVEKGIRNETCIKEAKWEDVALARCLTKLGVKMQDSRDEFHKNRFHPIPPLNSLFLREMNKHSDAGWVEAYDYYKTLLVDYSARSFLSQNLDYTISSSVLELMQSSSLSVLKKIFQADAYKIDVATSNLSGAGRNNSRRRLLTAATAFRNSLTELLQKLVSGTPHFVRCFRPNKESDPYKFSNDHISAHFNCVNLLSTVHIRKVGYSYWGSKSEFISRFYMLGGFFNSVPEIRSQNVKKVLESLRIQNYRIGKTKVFICYRDWRRLVNARNLLVSRVVLAQSCVRRWLALKRFDKQAWRRHKAATKIQSAVRGWLSRRRIRRMNIRRGRSRHKAPPDPLAVTDRVLYASVKKRSDRNETTRLKAVLTIQSYFRGWKVRKVYRAIRRYSAQNATAVFVLSQQIQEVSQLILKGQQEIVPPPPPPPPASVSYPVSDSLPRPPNQIYNFAIPTAESPSGSSSSPLEESRETGVLTSRKAFGQRPVPVGASNTTDADWKRLSSSKTPIILLASTQRSFENPPHSPQMARKIGALPVPPGLDPAARLSSAESADQTTESDDLPSGPKQIDFRHVLKRRVTE